MSAMPTQTTLATARRPQAHLAAAAAHEREVDDEQDGEGADEGEPGPRVGDDGSGGDGSGHEISAVAWTIREGFSALGEGREHRVVARDRPC